MALPTLNTLKHLKGIDIKLMTNCPLMLGLLKGYPNRTDMIPWQSGC